MREAHAAVQQSYPPAGAARGRNTGRSPLGHGHRERGRLDSRSGEDRAGVVGQDIGPRCLLLAQLWPASAASVDGSSRMAAPRVRELVSAETTGAPRLPAVPERVLDRPALRQEGCTNNLAGSAFSPRAELEAWTFSPRVTSERAGANHANPTTTKLQRVEA